MIRLGQNPVKMIQANLVLESSLLCEGKIDLESNLDRYNYIVNIESSPALLVTGTRGRCERCKRTSAVGRGRLDGWILEYIRNIICSLCMYIMYAVLNIIPQTYNISPLDLVVLRV